MARKTIKTSQKLPEFFKVLNGDDLSEHLRIPPAYIQYVNGLPSRCALRGPSGKLWTVGLKKRGNDLFFQGGWRRFVNDHELQIGDFVTFDHDGNSLFDVQVYNQTGSEKEANQAPAEDENTETYSIEGGEADEHDAGSSSNEDKGVDELEIEESEDEDGEEQARTSNRKKRNSIRSGKRPATEKAEETSTEYVVFKSKHPYFVGNYIRNQYYLRVPKEIAISERLNSLERVNVEDPEGRSWTVKLIQNDRLLMTKGLIQCYRANKVAVGDTVGFELVKKAVMKMHIFRGEGGKRCHILKLASGHLS